MLKERKMKELSENDSELQGYYQLQENGFYKVKELDGRERELLKNKFRSLGFSALNFTDSRSAYQFYPLARLWNDIQIALKHDIRVWHPATEPVLAGELYRYLSGEEFVNELPSEPADYDYRTVWDKEFGGEHGYMMDKGTVLEEIKRFILNGA